MAYTPLPVNDDLMESTYSVPTVVANRFVVSTTPQSFRLVFGESRTSNSPINWRVALSLTPFEAYELSRVLEALLVPFKADIESNLGERAAGQASHAPEDK
jgi:hypothetical protein